MDLFVTRLIMRPRERVGIALLSAGISLAAFCLVGWSSSFVCAQSKHLSMTFEQPMRDAEYPELVYWFVTPATFAPGRVEQDVEHIAHDTYFTFPFLTQRKGVVFSKVPKPNGFVPPSCPKWPDWCTPFSGNPGSHALVAEIVRDAHHNGLKIGMTFDLGAIDTRERIPIDQTQTVVSSAEATLDAQGRAMLTAGSKMRFAPPEKSELLRVYVFRKMGEGEYDASTLEDVTGKVKTVARVVDPFTGVMDISIDLGPQFAGETVFAMQQTYLNALDLFNVAFDRWLRQTLDEYRDVPLDGAALDEFGYTRLLGNPPWRGLFAGKGFQARFEASTGLKLPETLFAMSYAPAGQPEKRVKAIDVYWDFVRSGPLRIENEFYQRAREVYGDKVFAGIHSTVHNRLTNDEPWCSGLDWWTEPRHYGQSDENLPLPLRMGLLVSHPGNIMYDQFYGWNVQFFAEKALNDARFDARIHYHGYNDTGAWGIDIGSRKLLDAVNPVEAKIRLLNRFDPAAPELPLLVVFGMPRLLNWTPNEADQNNYNLNGSLHIEEKVKALWDAGYRCALVPSDLIDNGSVRLDAQGRPLLHGHTFRAVIYLYPEYAKQSTLSFLAAYVRHGGALMLEGMATRDFDGKPIDKQFAAIEAGARVKSFSIDDVDKLGVTKDPLRNIGGTLEDGSVILTDLPSLQQNTPKSFEISVSGHRFSGSYEGVFAIKAARNGTVEKLACGDCTSLLRDGSEVLHMKTPADLVLKRNSEGGYNAVIAGAPGSNAIEILR